MDLLNSITQRKHVILCQIWPKDMKVKKIMYDVPTYTYVIFTGKGYR